MSIRSVTAPQPHNHHRAAGPRTTPCDLIKRVGIAALLALGLLSRQTSAHTMFEKECVSFCDHYQGGQIKSVEVVRPHNCPPGKFPGLNQDRITVTYTDGRESTQFSNPDQTQWIVNQYQFQDNQHQKGRYLARMQAAQRVHEDL